MMVHQYSTLPETLQVNPFLSNPFAEMKESCCEVYSVTASRMHPIQIHNKMFCLQSPLVINLTQPLNKAYKISNTQLLLFIFSALHKSYLIIFKAFTKFNCSKRKDANPNCFRSFVYIDQLTRDSCFSIRIFTSIVNSLKFLHKNFQF